LRLVDAYWWEITQHRAAKTPDLTETVVQSDAADVCRKRRVYVPMTTEEYDPTTDSLNVNSSKETYADPVSIRYVTISGTRYMERIYPADNMNGCVKTAWIMKTQGMAVTDMVRSMSITQRPSGTSPESFWLTFPKPTWYDPDKDKLELYRAADTSKPKDQWTSAQSEIQEGPTVVNDTIRIRIYPGYDKYGLWIYHSTGGTDLRSAVITETSKTATVGSTVTFFPMPLTAQQFDENKDLLWIFAGGAQRADFTIVTAAYEDGGSADFLQFQYGIAGTVEFRIYASTADPKADVRGYTPEQVEEGLKAYEIVTQEVPHFIDAGFLQVGEATARKNLTTQQYTMADGSVCVYPAQNPVTRMTLELECTERQAHHLEEALCHVPLLLTGVKYGAEDADQTIVYPAGIGRLYTLDGEAEIGEKYAGSGIYSVKLPLIVQTGEDGERFCDLLGIMMYFDGSLVPEGVSAYRYSPRERVQNPYYGVRPSGLFVRKNVYFTASDTFSFKFVKSRQSMADPINVLYQGDTVVKTNLEPGTVQTFNLEPGENVFTFYFRDGSTTPRARYEDYRIVVYRQVTV